MLPDMTMPVEEAGRGLNCVREIAIHQMIAAMTQDQISRAQHMITATPGELHQYRPGDSVDFHRPPSTKDA